MKPISPMKAAYLATRYRWGKQQVMTLEEWVEKLKVKKAEKIIAKRKPYHD